MKIWNKLVGTLFIFGIFSSNGYTAEFNNNFLTVGYYRDSAAQMLPLLLNSNDQGASWSSPSGIITQLPADFNKYSVLDSASCNQAVCIAVGSYNSSTYPLSKILLAVSQNHGTSWSYIPTQPNSYSGGASYGAARSSCNDLFCVIALSYYNSKDKRLLPLIAISKDHGSSWSYPESVINQLPKNYYSGHFNGINCESDLCIGTGSYEDRDENRFPLLTIGKNQGTSWEYPTLHLPPNAEAVLNRATCYADFCLAIGGYRTPDEKYHPVILRSTDEGSTWTSAKNVQNNPLVNGVLTSLHCENGVCIASGFNAWNTEAYDPLPLVAMSYDSGASWTYPSTILSTLPPESKDAHLYFMSSSCHGTVCMAAGWNMGDGTSTLIAVSHDQGVTWSYVDPLSFADFPKSSDIDVHIRSLAFTHNKWTLIGVYGNHTKGTKPFVATSENNGKSWALSSISLPADFNYGEIHGSYTLSKMRKN